MDGSQDLLDAFNARLGVLTWESAVSVKDLLRETLRRSTAQRVTPAGPNVIETMVYGCRVAEVTTSLFISDTMQVLCERLQAERAYVAEAYAVYMEAGVERRRQEATAAAAARPQPAPVPQGPWPPLPGVAASSQPPPAYRKAHLSPGPGAVRAPSAAVPPPGGAAAAGDPLRAAPGQGSWARSHPPAPCEVPAWRTARPIARGLERGRAAARAPAVPWRHGGTGGGEGQGSALPRGRAHPREPLHGCPFAGAGQGECRKDSRAFLRSGGARRRSRGAGDSRSAAGPSTLRPRTRVQGTDRSRPSRALCRPRLSTCTSGPRGGAPLSDPLGGRLPSRRLARLPTEDSLGVGPRVEPPPQARLPPRPLTLGPPRDPRHQPREGPWTGLSSASRGSSIARLGRAIPRATIGQKTRTCGLHSSSPARGGTAGFAGILPRRAASGGLPFGSCRGPICGVASLGSARFPTRAISSASCWRSSGVWADPRTSRRRRPSLDRWRMPLDRGWRPSRPPAVVPGRRDP